MIFGLLSLLVPESYSFGDLLIISVKKVVLNCDVIYKILCFFCELRSFMLSQLLIRLFNIEPCQDQGDEKVEDHRHPQIHDVEHVHG